jgi:NAD(P)H dehydrogenase (quinone)
MIETAKQNGVEHFVYHSVLHPQIEVMNHHWQKMRVEEMLFESGIPFTILQPAPYMQNLLSNWKSILEDGVLRVPYSIDSKFSFLDLEDLAEATKIILTEPNHKNAVYELAGTNPLSYTEVAEIFSKVLNRKVKAEKEEISDWRLRATGLSEYALENLVRNPNVLKWILKREPQSMESFVERVLNQNDSNP